VEAVTFQDTSAKQRNNLINSQMFGYGGLLFRRHILK